MLVLLWGAQGVIFQVWKLKNGTLHQHSQNLMHLFSNIKDLDFSTRYPAARNHDTQPLSWQMFLQLSDRLQKHGS